MSQSFNKITIIGYLGRDPELKQTPQGKTVCELAVATTERRKEESITTWFRVVFWGSQAEVANRYLAKGRRVYVEGHLRAREWNDREGRARFTLEVQGGDLKFLDSNNEEAMSAQP